MNYALELAAVSKQFGALRAVDGVSLSLPVGARHALIGPNGAGKSTLLRLITGDARVDGGSVTFEGMDVTGETEAKRARRGITQTFQHSELFGSMTVVDNVRMGLYRVSGAGWRRLRGAWDGLRGEAMAIAEQTGLASKADQLVETLSHGERRQLEIGVALAVEPRLLLLDEPAAGMTPHETGRLAELIVALPPEVTIVFVEHDLDLVFELAETVTVLHLGRELATGTAPYVRSLDEVQEAYLGGAHSESLFLS